MSAVINDIEPGEARPRRLRWRLDAGATVSLLFLCVVALLSVAAPLIAPYSPTAQDLTNTLAESSAATC